ncbi:30S ribosome-binding factor RbfA [Engelhardtia mirabilis]|uniref:Ribosome-binding factor A n=1 Tax=Engelhardtia mirabilis TaxID=2528011 RepID=A0A518BMP2_9BACT|nr:Ribosome-binding factor A [Planctomycetes bacterium Pla133]QDV02577.1 Ribosome-binding factor A [Planctomycetes bacterium Pla86]
MANPRTIAKLQARILERAAYCVEFELNDPRVGMITLTRCELSSDLAHAKIFFTVLGGPTERRKTERALESAAGFVQRQLGRVLRTRKIPRVRWAFDESVEYADEMDRMIREALQRDQQIRPRGHEDEGPALDDPLEEDELDREVEEFLEARDEEAD